MSEENNVGLRENQEYNAQVTANTVFMNELKNKLPEYFTTSGSFDLEKFQENLKENNIDELSSGYQLDFIGKNLAKKQAGERPSTVIVPDMEHNEKPENKKSENLFLTGDNLEVLRHLQSAYQNSIDFIYIDPPYNTGSDGFVYPDKFEYTDEQLKDNFALTDKELERLKSIQGKSTHSAWLTFMYPRLYLAKKLLKDSGVIFVSIDDNEQANLKLLMDETFGENGFLSENIIIVKTEGRRYGSFAKTHEYLLTYAIQSNLTSLNEITVDGASFTYKDDLGGFNLTDLRNQNAGAFNSGNRPNLRYSFFVDTNNKDKNGFMEVSTQKEGNLTEVQAITVNGNKSVWRWGKEKSTNESKNLIAREGSDGVIRIYQKYRKLTQTAKTLWQGTDFISNKGTREVQELFDGLTVFDFPKSLGLLKRTLEIGTNEESVVLDFFAGSATTADAVMQLNAEDGGKRKFILAQLPEPTPENSVAKKSDYATIDQISRERIKRAGAKIKSENPLTTADLDTGFKHYRFVEPNQKVLDQIEFDANMSLDLFDDMISLFSSENLSVDGKATGFDTLLQTYLLADNYTFETPVMMKDFAGANVAYVNNTRLYIITDAWSAENTKALVNAIGTNELTVQTIVVYGYTLPMEAIRELEIALNQLETKVNLQIRY